jgi:hypothetical protein
MNERIKELAEQIVCFEQDMDGSMEPNEDGQWIRVDELEKFAELIVQECLMIVYERQVLAPTDDDGYFKVALDMVSKDIEQHFGVEE